MNIHEANTAHEYIMDHDLLNEVEARTKKKWKGNGSRSTYYNGLTKTRAGKETGLVEELMLLEAHALMIEHSSNLQVQEAA